jgi:triphosphoribosyl-dephospho-CoA synthase
MSELGSLRGSYSIGRFAELACLLEVTASKPGNVHRGADFEDVTFFDFAASAVAMGQAIDDTIGETYGATVMAVANRTIQAAGSNTNLGINLLVSLLAKACREDAKLDVDAVQRELQKLDRTDSQKVYQAIGIMNPGGLNRVDDHDVNGSAPESLIEAMEAASDRDRIAAQFTNGFADVFDESLPGILEGQSMFADVMQGIVWAHVRLMAMFPDSLIVRKCGIANAEQSQAMAQKALDAISGGPEAFFAEVSNLDFWLRSDGHKRNPGTTADLIAAGLFVGLYNGDLALPFSSND